MGPRAIDARDTTEVIGGLIPSAKFTTSIIVLLNIAAFLATNWGGYTGQVLFQLGDKNSEAILSGHQWWRLVTAGFLHGGFLHIGMNMWVLYDLGAEVERTYGTARFLFFYFAATVCGFLLSSYFVLAPSVGASAGLFGLIGAMIAFGMRNRTEVGRRIRGFYIKWAVYGMAMGFLPGFRIDNFAHLGGLLAGISAAYVAGTPAHSSYFTERFWRVIAILSIAITAYSFWIVFREFVAYRSHFSFPA